MTGPRRPLGSPRCAPVAPTAPLERVSTCEYEFDITTQPAFVDCLPCAPPAAQAKRAWRRPACEQRAARDSHGLRRSVTAPASAQRRHASVSHSHAPEIAPAHSSKDTVCHGLGASFQTSCARFPRCLQRRHLMPHPPTNTAMPPGHDWELPYSTKKLNAVTLACIASWRLTPQGRSPSAGVRAVSWWRPLLTHPMSPGHAHTKHLEGVLWRRKHIQLPFEHRVMHRTHREMPRYLRCAPSSALPCKPTCWSSVCAAASP